MQGSSDSAVATIGFTYHAHESRKGNVEVKPACAIAVERALRDGGGVELVRT